ncbi:hypothetical protein LTR53_014383 [Teratosphaeriaceae sp. CCFEE 6253]|nr:hypothetical protein LTR53_014383 [Teratosphaeriaceae sp. CCFEE 6253]
MSDWLHDLMFYHLRAEAEERVAEHRREEAEKLRAANEGGEAGATAGGTSGTAQQAEAADGSAEDDALSKRSGDDPEGGVAKAAKDIKGKAKEVGGEEEVAAKEPEVEKEAERPPPGWEDKRLPLPSHETMPRPNRQEPQRRYNRQGRRLCADCFRMLPRTAQETDQRLCAAHLPECGCESQSLASDLDRDDFDESDRGDFSLVGEVRLLEPESPSPSPMEGPPAPPRGRRRRARRPRRIGNRTRVHFDRDVVSENDDTQEEFTPSTADLLSSLRQNLDDLGAELSRVLLMVEAVEEDLDEALLAIDPPHRLD